MTGSYLFRMSAALLLWCLLSSGNVFAERLRPFVLADVSRQPMSAVIEKLSERLKSDNFQLVGSYTPYPGAYVVAVTSPELLQIATDDVHASWLAALRIAVTKVGGEVQTSYVNPEYYRYAYRIDRSLAAVGDRLRKALGARRTFGAMGLTPDKLRRYHYAFGMEYFDDQQLLAEYANYAEAVRNVGEQLRAHGRSVSRVYQVDLPDVSRTLIGVEIKQGDGADALIMRRIDKGRYRHTAHLPYEILIDGGKVLALHPRFRIAIDFPDLKMSGRPSFFQIINAPGAILRTLTQAVGGKVTVEGSSDFFQD